MEKNGFIKVKILLEKFKLKIILLKNNQNNYEERLMTKRQKVLASSLNVLHNYFDLVQTKLFSDLYRSKFSAKSFFPCSIRYITT